MGVVRCQSQQQGRELTDEDGVPTSVLHAEEVLQIGCWTL